jgi:hypothetical protein
VEETSDIGKLEIATEREIQRGLSIEKNLSQSWEDLSLVSQYNANIFLAHETFTNRIIGTFIERSYLLKNFFAFHHIWKTKQKC